MPIEQLIMTDRAPGKGIDTQRRGYQLAACSPGVDEASRAAVQRICTPLGNTVHESAPREWREREERWIITPGRPRQMPDEILDGFPVIWSYARLREDWFALSRIRYIGLSHDNRAGNFIAHALLFSPDMLAAAGIHPLALSRANLFRSDDDGQTTELPALAALPALTAGTSVGFTAPMLRKPPMDGELPRLLSALGLATEGGDRPMLIKIADWRQAPAVIETLLSLLPFGGRSRLTFCTHQAGAVPLSGSPGASGSAEAGAKRTYDLVFFCGQNGSSSAIPTQNFTVFDLDSNAPPAQSGAATSAYAAFASTAVRENAENRLGFHHGLARKIGVDRDCKSWDALVPLAQLGGLTAQAPALAEPFKTAVAVASTPARAAGALEWLVDRVSSLCEAERLDQLRAIAPSIAPLVDCALSDTPPPVDPARGAGPDAGRTPSIDSARAFIAKAAGHAATALRRGRARLAEQIFLSCGRDSERQVTQALNTQFNSGGAPIASGPEERPAMASLLLRGFQFCQARQKPNVAMPLLAQLMLAAYRAAGDLGAEALDKAWQQTGESIVRYFAEPRGERLYTLRDLLGTVPPQMMQDGCARLNLALLTSPEVTPDEVPGVLQTLASLVPACPPQDNLPQRAVSEAHRLIRDPLKLCITLAGMCDAAGTGKAAAQEFFNAFAQVAQAVNRPTLRTQLAAARCSVALAAEMLSDIEQNVPSARERWEKMFSVQPQALDGVCQATAAQVRAGRTHPGENFSHVLTMAEWLLALAAAGAAPADRAATGSGQLIMAVLAAAPLEPLSGVWKRLIDRLPAGLDLTAEPRLAVLRCISTTQAAAETPGWSLASFPHADPLWKVAASLTDADRTEALVWCHQLLTLAGLTTPADANALVAMLHPLGRRTPAEIAEFILGIVRERDPVTQITAAMALAQATADDPRRANGQPEVFAILVESFDKTTRRLMESHLKLRCARGGQAYEDTMEKLCQQANLTPPPRATAQPQQSAGMLTGMLKLFRRAPGK